VHSFVFWCGTVNYNRRSLRDDNKKAGNCKSRSLRDDNKETGNCKSRSLRDDNKETGNCKSRSLRDDNKETGKGKGRTLREPVLRTAPGLGSGGEFYFSFGFEAEPWTMRSLSTLKAPGAELACIPAMEESIWLRTTP
jgi:hypothetical protein